MRFFVENCLYLISEKYQLFILPKISNAKSGSKLAENEIISPFKIERQNMPKKFKVMLKNNNKEYQV